MTESSSGLWDFQNGQRFVRSWLPELEPVCALVFVHGLGDHSGRFAVPAKWLVAKQVAVYAFDQMGHGQSPGPRVCVSSYDDLLNDIESLLTQVKQRHPDLPLGLFGQSMGGNLVLNYALRQRPHAQLVVAGSPMLRSENAPGPILNLFARGLMALAPNFCIPAPVDATQLAHDTKIQSQFLSDPHVVRKVSLRLGAALIDTGEWAIEHADELPFPVLVMHGSDDKITSPAGSEAFVAKSGGKAELQIWDGGRHDLHLDLDHEAYFQRLWSWVERRLQN